MATKKYLLDSAVQDLEVYAIDPTDEGSLDKDIHPRRPIIRVEYSSENKTKKTPHIMPTYRVLVFDPKHSMKWDAITGPATDLLKLFVWYHQSLGRYSSVGRSIYAFRSFDDEVRVQLMLYTNTNRYSITGHINLEDDKTYLGCQASSRMARPGEDWTRGSDLADGEFSLETFHRILGDILSYELIDRSTKRETVWGLFPDDGPNQGHSHERKLGYVRLGTDGIDEDGEPFTAPDEPMRPFSP